MRCKSIQDKICDKTETNRIKNKKLLVLYFIKEFVIVTKVKTELLNVKKETVTSMYYNQSPNDYVASQQHPQRALTVADYRYKNQSYIFGTIRILKSSHRYNKIDLNSESKHVRNCR